MAEPSVATTFRRPFAEQIAAFRLRLGNLVPTATWQDLWKGQHDRAFVVAGALKADLLADLAGAVQKSIEQGTTLDEFRRDFRRIVEERGWHGWTGEGSEAGEAWRTRVIYRTNMRTSYMSGRHAQLVAGNFAFWVYRHGGSREPRIKHLGWDGLILEARHPFWQSHFPPNGWGCNCYVIGARTRAAAIRRGGKSDLRLPEDWNAVSPRSGEPEGIDRGWGYAPGASVVEDIARLIAEKAPKLPAALGADLARASETPPAPPPMPVREARSLKEAGDILVELGLSQKPVPLPRGSDLAGVNAAIKALAEIEQRFELQPMQAVGSSKWIADRSRLRHSPKASAWFSPGFNVMGWNKIGFSREPWHTPEIRARLAEDRGRAHAARVDRLPEGAAKRVAQRVAFQWTVVEGGDDYPRSVAIHESGHRLDFNNRPEFDDAASGWRDGWHLALSEYGATNRDEFVAESFVLYMIGEEEHWRIKPELLALFKKKDRFHAE